MNDMLEERDFSRALASTETNNSGSLVLQVPFQFPPQISTTKRYKSYISQV